MKPPYPYQNAVMFARSKGWRTAPLRKRFTLDDLRDCQPPSPDNAEAVLREVTCAENKVHLRDANYFRLQVRGKWRPMAIVAHPFDPERVALYDWEVLGGPPECVPFNAHAKWAARNALLATRLPYCWRRTPPVYISVMYTRPMHRI